MGFFMTNRTKQYVIAMMGGIFLLSLVFVQWLEVVRKEEESGLREHHISIPENAKRCVECHQQTSPGIIDHWRGSTHARTGVGCVECHQADKQDADSFLHEGEMIATIVTPKDCARCHEDVYNEFAASHHAKGGQILASLDNYLAETVEGFRGEKDNFFNPHSPTPGFDVDKVNGKASAFIGCQQCHGSKVALLGTDGSMINVDDLKPDANGKPTNLDVLAKVQKNEKGRPLFHASTWPNTGIGRINLDGSAGSCTACHSRHDFSPRRARQPENCGKCHLGPDHPQKEIYEESKHGVAYRDLREKMNLDSKNWVLGEDYSAAPTCATCHMSGNIRNKGKITHDPGKRISWTNRPPISMRMDTDKDGKVIKEKDPEKRKALIVDTAEEKRDRMKEVCSHCHTPDYINNFYKQYDDLIVLYNEKFAKPGEAIMNALWNNGLISKKQFDDEIEWTWFYLWHHEGRRARHGASMMAPDYTHWHGMYEVAERFYVHFIPQAEHIIEEAKQHGKEQEALAAEEVINNIMARPEHQWKKE